MTAENGRFPIEFDRTPNFFNQKDHAALRAQTIHKELTRIHEKEAHVGLLIRSHIAPRVPSTVSDVARRIGEVSAKAAPDSVTKVTNAGGRGFRSWQRGFHPAPILTEITQEPTPIQSSFEPSV